MVSIIQTSKVRGGAAQQTYSRKEDKAYILDTKKGSRSQIKPPKVARDTITLKEVSYITVTITITRRIIRLRLFPLNFLRIITITINSGANV